MIGVKRSFFTVILCLVLLLSSFSLYGAEHQGHMSKSAKDAGAGQTPDYPTLAAPGTKVPIGNGFYLIYGFDKKPKLGMIILKVEDFLTGSSVILYGAPEADMTNKVIQKLNSSGAK